MPRANRHFLPNNICYITQRYHKQEFLFKFARDRQNCLDWLFEAKKRFGLSILNYMVTEPRRFKEKPSGVDRREIESRESFPWDKWTESVAVGGQEFVTKIKEDLGVRVLGRTTLTDCDQHKLREFQKPYKAHFAPEKGPLRQNLSFKWDNYLVI